MSEKAVEDSICANEEESWDTSWKWSWFLRDTWKSSFREEKNLRVLDSLLHKSQAKTVLDCSCGLGENTVLMAEMGYDVEGSDGSVVAVRYAPRFAQEEGFTIRFFHSRWEDLGRNCARKYDCVFNDYFDEIKTRGLLQASAKGIYSVLSEGGIFVFGSTVPKGATKSDLEKLIEKEWEGRKQFDISPPYEKNGVRVTSLEVAEKTSEGILENRIFLIEEQGIMRAEIAFIMNPRIKWTFQDFVDVLKGAGFRKVDLIEEEGMIVNVAMK